MTSNARLQSQAMVDAAERAKVLDATRSFIVQAPAGSGKTELLMQRYLTLLAHESVSVPESVLAITFTRKAAAEMRNRVLNALESAGGPEPAEAHKRASRELARKVMERDRALGWDLLANPERLEIRTVDSFCERIANRTPLLAGLGRSPAIAEDFDVLYAEATQRTLLMLGDENAENREAVAQVLRDQDNNFDRVQGLLVDLLKRRDQWGRVVGGRLAKTAEEQQEIREQLEASLRDAVTYELRNIREQVVRSVPREVLVLLLEHARFGAGNVADDFEIAPLRDVKALPAATPEQLLRWQALTAFCLTGKQFRKRYDAGMGFASGELHKARKNACTDLLKDIAESAYADPFCAALCRVKKLPPAKYSDRQWDTLVALFRVLPLAVAHLRTIFAERGEVDHIEVALSALTALRDEEHPTELAMHLGYSIQHLLVDEFQDTSLSQAELLERLIEAWSPESGNTLFVVGDPMQSIYGFRQAEVTLFSRAWQNGFGRSRWPLERARLVANFRSRPELVTWFNETFREVLDTENDVAGAVKYSAAIAAEESSGSSGVRFHSAMSKDFDEEAARVLEVVQQEVKTDAKSIAILVRSRSHVAHIAPLLRESGVPFRAKDIDVLGERQTVRDLHAITNAMVHLSDRAAWLTLLRGPWFGMELADLWELCREGYDESIWDLLQQRRERLSVRAQKVLERVMPVLTVAMERRGRVSLRSLVEAVWLSLGGPAAIAGRDFEAKRRDAETYLALLQEVETSGEVDEKRLEQGIANLFTKPDTSPNIRVQVMTIHGAKGLEFDVVILPGLNRRTESSRPQLLNWRERVIGDRRDLLMAPMEPVGSNQKNGTTISRYLNTLAGECATEETKRLLYVAATRAKERLHLVTTMPEHDKPPRTGSLLSLLPSGVVGKFPEQPDPSEDEEPEVRKPAVLRRLRADWAIPAAVAPLAFETRYPVSPKAVERKHTFERVGEDLRRIGTITHRFLQQIGEEGAESWKDERVAKLAPIVRALLLQEGVRQSELGRAEQTVLRALRNTLGDEHGQWILKRRDAANNEFALSAVLDTTRQSIKVDRTFVEDNVRWVVDYKTSDQEGSITEKYLQEQVTKYQDDLRKYATVLRALDGREVRGGLYFPLLKIWREVDIKS